MSMQKLIINGKLPNLNEYTLACRTNRYMGAKLKQQAEQVILIAIKQQKLQPVKQPVQLAYTWIEPNKRRDKDNIAFAQKFVQDALVKAGILKNDSWNYIIGFSHNFKIDKDKARIEVTITEQEEKNE